MSALLARTGHITSDMNVGEGGHVGTREAAAADNMAAGPGVHAQPLLTQLNHSLCFVGKTVNYKSLKPLSSVPLLVNCL